MAKLNLLGLPIGNADDLTPRCRQAIEEGHYFFVEDTRVFRDRMKRFGLSLAEKELYAFHDKDRSKESLALELLSRGENIYLASDAGSPLISDPAYPLVRRALEEGHELANYPGCNAVTTALELSGLPPHPFSFYGFTSKEREKRKKAFANCLEREGTHIFFESPYRILESLEDLTSLGQETDICVAKELTKTFQSVYRFKAKDFHQYRDSIVTKGEFVLLFHGSQKKTLASGKLRGLAEEALKKPDNKRLSKVLSEILGLSSKEVYSLLGENSRKTD